MPGPRTFEVARHHRRGGGCFDRGTTEPVRVRRLTHPAGHQVRQIVRRGGGTSVSLVVTWGDTQSGRQLEPLLGEAAAAMVATRVAPSLPGGWQATRAVCAGLSALLRVLDPDDPEVELLTGRLSCSRCSRPMDSAVGLELGPSVGPVVSCGGCDPDVGAFAGAADRCAAARSNGAPLPGRLGRVGATDADQSRCWSGLPAHRARGRRARATVRNWPRRAQPHAEELRQRRTVAAPHPRPEARAGQGTARHWLTPSRRSA